MYVAEIVRKRSGAPVLSRKEIDIIGENLVSDFNPDAMQTPQEIDIDLLSRIIWGQIRISNIYLIAVSIWE